MIIKQAALHTVVGISSQIPETDATEFAFVGRSNVGKSSLINALLNRKSLARVSSEPGKTRTINFYQINESFFLVDLPGYGYAKISRAEQARWTKAIEAYLKKSRRLAILFLLIDIRHEPGENDRQMYAWIKASGRRVVILATKADKITRNQLPRQLSLIRKTLELSKDVPIIPFSSQTKAGREEVWAVMEEVLEKDKENDKNLLTQ